jgi:hypothetical protein
MCFCYLFQIKAPIKDSLNRTIKSDYAGLNGTNIVSIGWNIINQKVSRERKIPKI